MAKCLPIWAGRLNIKQRLRDISPERGTLRVKDLKPAEMNRIFKSNIGRNAGYKAVIAHSSNTKTVNDLIRQLRTSKSYAAEYNYQAFKTGVAKVYNSEIGRNPSAKSIPWMYQHYKGM